MAKKFLIIGNEPWFGPLLSKHHIVLELCKQHEVLYQDPVYHMGKLLSFEFPHVSPYSIVYHQIRPDNFSIIKPWWFPKTNQSSWIRYLAQRFVILQYKFKAPSFNPDFIISTSPNYAFLANVWDCPFVYYCVDTHPDRRYEAATLDVADLIVTATQKLYQDFIAYEEKLKYLPHGITLENVAEDDEPISPSDMAQIAKPIVGYIGAVNSFLDVPLLIEVANRMPTISFVLIGPHTEGEFGGALPPDRLHALQLVPNIFLLGPKPSSELKQYINSFDIGMIPYDIEYYRIHFSYHKVLQYLALEKPVVTTVAPPAGNSIPSFYVGENADTFVSGLELALSEFDEKKARDIREFTAKNTWEKRVGQLGGWLNELHIDRSA